VIALCARRRGQFLWTRKDRPADSFALGKRDYRGPLRSRRFSGRTVEAAKAPGAVTNHRLPWRVTFTSQALDSWIASSNRRFWKLSAGRKVAPIRRLPTAVRVPMLRRCSLSPRQKPPRSALPSIVGASYRRRSSCAGCFLGWRTTCRPGSARASLPDGSHCRHEPPGCLGAGAGSHKRSGPPRGHPGGPDRDRRVPTKRPRLALERISARRVPSARSAELGGYLRHRRR
jgi:hypothetical protein